MDLVSDEEHVAAGAGNQTDHFNCQKTTIRQLNLASHRVVDFLRMVLMPSFFNNTGISIQC